jgi:hypothetical protein
MKFLDKDKGGERDKEAAMLKCDVTRFKSRKTRQGSSQRGDKPRTASYGRHTDDSWVRDGEDPSRARRPSTVAS